MVRQKRQAEEKLEQSRCEPGSKRYKQCINSIEPNNAADFRTSIRASRVNFVQNSGGGIVSRAKFKVTPLPGSQRRRSKRTCSTPCSIKIEVKEPSNHTLLQIFMAAAHIPKASPLRLARKSRSRPSSAKVEKRLMLDDQVEDASIDPNILKPILNLIRSSLTPKTQDVKSMDPVLSHKSEQRRVPKSYPQVVKESRKSLIEVAQCRSHRSWV